MKPRVLQVLLAIALVCVGSPVVAFQASQSVASAPEIPPGPSMKETETWIKRELRPMGSDYIVTKYRGTTWADKYEIESAVLSECVLTIRQVSQHEAHLDDGTVVTAARQTTTSRITMKDVDVRRDLRAIEDGVGTDSTKNKPSYLISVIALSDRGDPFLYETNAGKTKKSVPGVRIRVRDQNMGNQAGEVFRRAAVLCGAPSQPVETSRAKTTTEAQSNSASANAVLSERQRTVQSETESPATKQASPGPAKMTNDDVIQLVNAGLSEQVVITSIHQAPAKNFDLTPAGLIALKKGGVSDAVIVVMQEKGPPVQSTAPSEANTWIRRESIDCHPNHAPA